MSSGRAALLIFVLSTLFSPHSIAQEKWDDDCLEKSEKKVQCQSDDQSILPITSFTKYLSGNAELQKHIEREFFWNFLADQYKQAQCETNLYRAFDLTPNDKNTICPDDAKGPTAAIAAALCKANPGSSGCPPLSKISNDAEKRQNDILTPIWNNLRGLATFDEHCETATRELVRIEHKRIANGAGDIIYDPTKDHALAQKEANENCEAKSQLLSKIWNGNTVEMQNFLKGWFEELKRNPNLAESQFRKTAIPIDRERHLKETGQANLIFENVIWGMACTTKKRSQVLASAMTERNGKLEPRSGSNDDQAIRRALIGDGGTAAISYINRSKYQAFAAPLACHLVKKYYAEPKKKEIVKAIVIGGVTTIVTLGAAAEVSGAVIVGSIIDAGLAIESAHQAYKTCRQTDFKPGTLQSSPVCKITEATGNDYNLVSTRIATQTACSSAVLDTAIASSGIAVGAVKLAQKMKGAYATEKGFTESELTHLANGSENTVYTVEEKGQTIAIRTNLFGHDEKIGEYEDFIKAEEYGGPKILGKTKIDGKPAMKMEFIKGKELKEVKNVTANQCKQIQAIIEKSVIDRIILSDIGMAKNVLLDQKGNVRIIDNRAIPYQKELDDRRIKLSTNFSGKELEQRILDAGHSPESNRRIYAEFIQKGGKNCAFLQPFLDKPW